MCAAVSNAVPEDPVVCLKTGHVFERSLIEKYLQEKGTCPMSGKEMTKDDLMPLKMGKPVKPRHTPAMSIPGILGMLHNVRPHRVSCKLDCCLPAAGGTIVVRADDCCPDPP
jgi:pre-mRNA-processing factor 19